MRVRLKGSIGSTSVSRTGGCRPTTTPGAAALASRESPARPSSSSAIQKAHEERRRPIGETLKGLIIDFQASSEFQQLRPKTCKDYTRYLAVIEQAFVGRIDPARISEKRKPGESPDRNS
jgi:hypothetical protein